MDATRIERVVEALGFELVTFERGGARRRPLVRLRIDRPEGEPGRSSVTVDDCARVARAVREELESEAEGDLDYSLEVSSPGVERPLTRPRDFERFAGHEVRLRGYRPLAGRAKELRGTLVGLGPEGDVAIVDVEGERLEVALGDLAAARLEYRWEEDL